MRGALEARESNKTKQGRILELDLDDQLVLTLQFWREYRTHHHLGLDWEVDESTVRRTIERVENALIEAGRFSLPARKALRDNVDFEVIAVGLAESLVERPKKR